MAEAVPAYMIFSSRRADTALRRTAVLWFLTAVVGQWIFAIYTMSYYGSRTLQRGLEGLKDTHLPNAYTPGDTMGNLAIGAHLLLAVILMVGGPLQLIPQVRQRFPKFHHWNGRAFLFAAVVASVSGLHMVWIRGSSVGDLGQHLGLSLNAVLILAFAAIALRYAMRRRIELHRRWALRLFLAANGVWFARLGLWLWVFVTGGVGVDFETFTGPFLTFLSFGQYLLPLAVLELYLRTQDRAGPFGRFAMAAALFALTIAMVIGIHQAATRIWLPRI